MFEKKHYILFIGKRFIEPGLVTLGKDTSFEGGEAVPYTLETLPDALRSVQETANGKIRVVLGEELVYITELSFPEGTRITREHVQKYAEESVPEDLRATQWDFQTLHYTEKERGETETLVQVAVMEHSFAEAFRKALEAVSLPIESIVPESYALASFVADQEGVSVIVEQDRESVALVAAEQGAVIATYVRPITTPDDLSLFLGFVKGKGKEVKRIVFSHFAEEERAPFRKFEEGYEILMENYNPLIGAAAQEVAGRDEAVLNIDVFPSAKKGFWRF